MHLHAAQKKQKVKLQQEAAEDLESSFVCPWSSESDDKKEETEAMFQQLSARLGSDAKKRLRLLNPCDAIMQRILQRKAEAI